MPFHLKGLWRHPDFVKLWIGRIVSRLGTEVTFLALPLTAVIFLDASPLQMGILAALGSLPSLILGLGVGVWIDRLRKRPVMVMASYGRALVLITVPAAAATQVLRMEHLYAVAFGIGILGAFFQVASRSILPSIVPRHRLVEANSKLAVGSSASQVVGPGVAGVLVQTITAPITLVVDAVTYVVSGLAVQSMRTSEPEPETLPTVVGFVKQAREGLAAVGHNAILLAIAVAVGGLAVFNAMFEAVWLLYVNSELGIEPLTLGLIFSIGGIGFALGAMVATRTMTWLGAGHTVIVAIAMVGISDLATPLAGGSVVAIAGVLTSAAFMFGVGATVYSIAQESIRQTVTPLRLQGRMNGVMNVLEVGLVPIGALAGGVMGQAIGLRPPCFCQPGGSS